MIKDYIIKQTLGKGTYGIVYKVQKINTNSIYVIKQIPLSGLNQKERNEVEQEAKILHLINSNYVVKYYDSFKENDNLNIVMEYCDGGDLNDFLLEKKRLGKPLEEPLIWKIFIKIAIGLADIHNLKILHRDLKTLNIFLKQSLDIKIGDLGVAKVLAKNSFARTVIGTPY
jgi:NIMA (never in mitosis gene a)-related kinase